LNLSSVAVRDKNKAMKKSGRRLIKYLEVKK
jgi:hypothetical protein